MNKIKYILFIVLAVFATIVQAEGYKGLTLDSCLSLAQQNNPSLRKAQLGVLRAEEVKAQAFTKYFPQIQGTAFGYHALHPIVEIGIDDIGNASVRDLLTTLYGSYGSALGLENSINLFQHGYMAGVTAVQPIFMGGKIVAGNKLAQVGVEAAKLQAQLQQRDILEQIEESYWLVYSLQEKQQIIDDAMSLLDTIYANVSVAVEAGLALPLDITQVEIRKNDIQRRQLQLQNGSRLARRALALSIGLENGDSVETVQADSNLDITTINLRENPVPLVEKQLLDLQVRAAELEKRMVLAEALPQVLLGANYGYSQWQMNILRDGINHKTGNGALFVTVNVPLTGWWETGHKLKEKQYAIEQAQIDADYLGSQLDLRTKQVYDQMTEAQALVQIQEKTLLQAQEAYNQLKINYDAGLATITDLLQTQMVLTQTKSDLTDAQIAYKVYSKRYSDLISQ